MSWNSHERQSAVDFVLNYHPQHAGRLAVEAALAEIDRLTKLIDEHLRERRLSEQDLARFREDHEKYRVAVEIQVGELKNKLEAADYRVRVLRESLAARDKPADSSKPRQHQAMTPEQRQMLQDHADAWPHYDSGKSAKAALAEIDRLQAAKDSLNDHLINMNAALGAERDQSKATIAKLTEDLRSSQQTASIRLERLGFLRKLIH